MRDKPGLKSNDKNPSLREFGLPSAQQGGTPTRENVREQAHRVSVPRQQPTRRNPTKKRG